MEAAVAAAWAMITGFIRMVGQVTAVPTFNSVVDCETPPRVHHTRGFHPVYLPMGGSDLKPWQS